MNIQQLLNKWNPDQDSRITTSEITKGGGAKAFAEDVNSLKTELAKVVVDMIEPAAQRKFEIEWKDGTMFAATPGSMVQFLDKYNPDGGEISKKNVIRRDSGRGFKNALGELPYKHHDSIWEMLSDQAKSALDLEYREGRGIISRP